MENTGEGKGLRLLVSGTRELLPFLENQDALSAWITDGNYPEVHSWCRSILRDCTLKGKWVFLKDAVMAGPEIELDKIRAMALLYFAFQLVVLSFRE